MMLQVLIAGVLLSAAPVEVLPLDGDPAVGELVSLDSTQVVVKVEGEDTAYRLSDLISVTPKDPASPTAPPNIVVTLIDGTQLACVDYEVASGKATLTLPDDQKLETPTASVASVRLKKQSDELARQWLAIEQREAAGDRVVIRKTSTVTVEDDGLDKIEKQVDALDWLEGVLYDVNDASVQFKFNDTLIPIKREKVEGVFYFHAAGGRAADPVCRVRENNGSLWNARSLSLDGDNLQLVSTTGLKATLPLRQVTKLDFSTGKILYLSDAEPETSEWTPFIATTSESEKLWYAPQNDGKGGFALGKMEVNGKPYSKGLALYSRTHLVYRVPEGFVRLAAVAGIDDRVRVSQGGSVDLVITGDGKTLLQQRITGKDETPLQIDLDISGVRRLGILVDYGGAAGMSDHLNLCNARITK
ncbi:MAG: NPCBM/NEW2 domain-containing protein [Pirellulaceae bacterium]